MDLNSVFPVLCGTPAKAATQRFKIYVRLLSHRIDTRELGHRVGAICRADGSLGQGFGQCAKDHVDDPLAGGGTPDYSTREHTVNECALGNEDLNNIQDALVVGNLWIEEGLNRVARCRLGCVETRC